MIILGIDPGTVSMGYGVVAVDGDRTQPLAWGVLKARARDPLPQRLFQLYHGVRSIIEQYHPEAVALEEPFMAENARSALAIGRAQAVAILAAVQEGSFVYQYSPAQVKQAVTNYGGSDKIQVQEMVRLQLGLAKPPQPIDAADALAVALCHQHHIHLSKLLLANE